MMKMNAKILTGMGMVLVAILVMSTLAVASAASINAENIIITPPELYEQAKDLENFHEAQGTETEVITTTWIYKNYEEAEDPPFEGYKDKEFPGEGYNYSLAKKIIAFLNDSATHPDLKYVTLLGNARLVPPSYYIYIAHSTTWNNWIPTDFFYASPDYDYLPDFGVGRLPVNNSDEAEHVVNKIISWDSALDWNWFKNVAMKGGKPYSSTWDYYGIHIDEMEYYIGEISVADVTNHNYLNGMDITKFYKTDGNFDREHILQSLSGGNGIVYITTHGDGDRWIIFGQRWTDVEDILSLPKSTELPVVISDACQNGAFDTNVYPQSPFPFSTSVGEAILLSDAGGIAYIGSSRAAWIDTNFHIDKGCVNLDEQLYMLGMVSKVFKAYHEGASFIGDITKNAMEDFYMSTDFSNKYNRIAYFEFVLLGDPALELPAQQPGTSYQKPNITAMNPDGYKEVFSASNEIGKLGEAPYFYFDKNITLQITTDSPTISIKRMEDIGSYDPNIVERIENISINGVFNYTFTATKEIDYLVRVSTADGKEGWFYLQTVEPEEDTTPPTIIAHSPIGDNVSIDTKIRVTFSEAMNQTSVQNAFTISPIVSGSFSWNNNTMFFTPDSNLSYNTTYTVTIGTGAEDLAGNNLEAEYSWVFTTGSKYNSPPVLSPIGNKTVDAGSLLEFTVSASDPDGDSLTYSASNLPEGASFVGQIFNWTPGYDQAGTYEVTFTVEDGRGGMDIETISITVNEVPQPELPLGSKDLDGDGLYEDINGDGKLDFDDIVYFLWHYRDNDFQDYKQYYDFDKDGDADVGDVIKLYVMWKW